MLTILQGNQTNAIRVSKTTEVDTIVYLGQVIPRSICYSDIPVIHFPLKDNANSFEKYNLLFSILTKLNGTVLISCRMGISRSVIVSAILRQILRKETFDHPLAINITPKELDKVNPDLFKSIFQWCRSEKNEVIKCYS